jgi:DNA-binding CsgD family transcriptional regulator
MCTVWHFRDGEDGPVAEMDGLHGSGLTGREADLKVIGEFLGEASVLGGALLLTGEPGIGKSALLNAAQEMASAAGVRVVRAGGVQLEADVSFAGLHQLALHLSDELEQLGAVHRGTLNVALGLASGPPVDRLVVSNAALALLRRAAEPRPLVVIVDDLQWLDRASAFVLLFAARRLAGSHVGLLAAFRTETQINQGDLVSHEVGALDDLASASLVDSRFPGLPPQVRQRVLSEARGNPLALLELPAELSAPQRSALQALPVALPLSRRLQGIFTSRVAELPAPTRYLLLLAVLEGTGNLELLQAAASGQREIDDLAPAEQAGLVHVEEDPGGLVFPHPLIRSAVMELAPSSELRRAHLALAAQSGERSERRAWHLAHASISPDEDVANLLADTARQAVRRGDAVGGVTALVRAAELSPRPSDRCGRLAEAAYLGATVTGALASVPALLAGAHQAALGSSGALYAAVAAAHFLLNGDGDIETAHRVLVDAITTRPGQSDAAMTGALQTLLMVCSLSDRADLWAPFHDGIRRLAAAAPAELRLLDSMCADPVRTAVGRLEQLDSAISSLTWETDPWRILTVSSATEHADRLAGCREALSRVARSSSDGGAALSAISALGLLSIAGFATGDWDAAQEAAEECLRMCEANGYTLRAWTPRALQALLAAARGEYDTALALNRQNIRWAMPRGIRQAQAAAHLAGSLAALGQGDFDAAYAEAAAISRPGVFASHVPYALRVPMTLVEAAVRTGRHAEAKAHVTAMQEAGIARISPRLAMLADASAAIAGPVHDAARRFDAALSVPGADRWPFEFAQVQLAYGEHLRRARKTTEARVQLGAALAAFRVLRASPWADRADNELRAAGLSVIRAEGHGSTVLTAQQQQIAALAAAGLTNRQIAQRLYLSHRTVADHLYQIFPKLGICTRAALRDALSVRSPG